MKKLIIAIAILAIASTGFCQAPITRMLDMVVAAKKASSGGTCDTCSGTYGPTATNGAEESINSDRAVLTKVTLSESCEGDNPTIYIYTRDGLLGTAFNIRYLIYDDDGAGGEPGTRLYISSEDTLINNTSFAWWSEAVANDACLSGVVWVGFVCTRASGAAYDMYNDDGGETRYVNISSMAAPETWDPGTDTHSVYSRSFYIGF